MHTAPRGLVDLNMRPAHDHKVAMRNGILEVQFRCLQRGGHWGHSMQCNLGGSQLVSQPAHLKQFLRVDIPQQTKRLQLVEAKPIHKVVQAWVTVLENAVGAPQHIRLAGSQKLRDCPWKTKQHRIALLHNAFQRLLQRFRPQNNGQR